MGRKSAWASARPGARLRRYFASRARTHLEGIEGVGHLLNQRLDVLGAMQRTGVEVDAFNGTSQLGHRRVEYIESCNRFGALATGH